MIRKKRTLILFFISFTLSACTGDNSDLIKYINDVKSRPGAPIEPLPRFSFLPHFKFPENDSRRSPFNPIDVKKTDDFTPDEHRAKQPLEAFPLDALKYVGILKQGNQLWALIQDPGKKIIPVRVGNYIGLNYGRVVSINANELKLEERIKKTGAWEKQITIIQLNTSK
ncbi:MAG: pilus assembly protein PilP [Legionella sp.]|nr:MAG: pilus assembly protein PilP [Legionella sp.]PJD99385.1 MAG: pilus assembly protein PilP [Legionella sp.]